MSQFNSCLEANLWISSHVKRECHIADLVMRGGEREKEEERKRGEKERNKRREGGNGRNLSINKENSEIPQSKTSPLYILQIRLSRTQLSLRNLS